MIGRRRFVAGALAVAGAAGLPACMRRPGEAAVPGCASLTSGVQLFTLRDALQRDVEATLHAVATLGIRTVELYGLAPSSERLFGLRLAELRALLDEFGLVAPFAHVGDELEDPRSLAAIAAHAHALGVETAVLALPREFTSMRDGRFEMVGPSSVAILDRLAVRLERAGRAFREQGLAFAYHNHHVEFMPPPDAPDVVPFDFLLERVPAGAMALELDIGWLAAAGRDPVRDLEAQRGRVVACHLKDFRDAAPGAQAPPQASLVEPGAGRVDFAAVLAAMRAGGVRHGFIEIDVTPDPLGAVDRGRRHLLSLPGC